MVLATIDGVTKLKELEKALSPDGGPVQEQYDKIQMKETSGNFHYEELPIDGDWMREGHRKRPAYERGLEIHSHRNFTSAWNRTAKTLKPYLEQHHNNWHALVRYLHSRPLRDILARGPVVQNRRPVPGGNLPPLAVRRAIQAHRAIQARQQVPPPGGRARPRPRARPLPRA